MIDIRLPLNDFLTLDPAGGCNPLFSKGKLIIVMDIRLPLNDFLILDEAGGLQPIVF